MLDAATQREWFHWAEDGDWTTLLMHLASRNVPNAAVIQDAFGMTLLHWACTEPTLPLDLFQRLGEWHRPMAQCPNQMGWYPLQVALRHHLPATHIQTLLQWYPESIALRIDGETSIEMAKRWQRPAHTLRLLERKERQWQDDRRPVSSSTRTSSNRTSSSTNGPETRLEPLALHLQHLVSELHQLQETLKENSAGSPRHSSTASTSTLSTQSSVLSTDSEAPAEVIETIAWHPTEKMGLSFHAVDPQTMCGARIKRFTPRCETRAVERLQPGDVLLRLNGRDVHNVPFDDIVGMLKDVQGQTHLQFIRPVSSTVRLTALLLDTLQTVHQAEATMRHSLAL